MPRRKQHAINPYEGIGRFRGGADTNATIYESMLHSAAFKDLSLRQRMLYVVAKAQVYSPRNRPDKDRKTISKYSEDRSYIYLNWHLIQEYGLYSEGNSSRLYKDLAALADHGFIETAEQNRHRRQRNIYKLSAAWQTWKPPE